MLGKLTTTTDKKGSRIGLNSRNNPVMEDLSFHMGVEGNNKNREGIAHVPSQLHEDICTTM